MRRRTLNALIVLSLAVLAGISTLWFRGHTRVDSIEFTSSTGAYHALQSAPIGFIRWVSASGIPEPAGWRIDPRRIARVYTFFPDDVLLLGGVATAHGSIGPWVGASSGGFSIPYRAVAVSDLHIAALALLTTIILVILRERSRRYPPNHCQICGYNLLATPGRCPECGAVPAKPAGSKT